MRKTVIALLSGLLLSTALPVAAGAQTLLFDYLGFDYEDPNPNPGTFGELTSGYVGLGTVPYLFAPLVTNTTLYEYTYVMSGLTSSNVTPIGSFSIIDYTGGTVQIYEDLKSGGTPADYGTNPPSAQAPPTFTDGTLILSATLTNFQFILNTANNTGSFEAVLTIDGGTQLGNFPLNQRAGWTFAGATGNALNIPVGYSHQIDGQTFLNQPTPARVVSWGRVKNLYR